MDTMKILDLFLVGVPETVLLITIGLYLCRGKIKQEITDNLLLFVLKMTISVFSILIMIYVSRSNINSISVIGYMSTLSYVLTFKLIWEMNWRKSKRTGVENDMNIMHELAIVSGKKLSKYSNDEYALEKLIYLMERFFNNLIWLSLLFITTSLLDVRITTLIVLLTFLPLRSGFGGYHVENPYFCILLSTLIPTFLGYFATKIHINVIIISTIYIFAFMSVYLKGVVDNPVRRLKLEQKQKFKKKGIRSLIIIFIVHLFMLDNTIVSNSIALGVLISFLNLYL